MNVLRRGVVAFLVLKLANLTINLVTFPVLADPPPAARDRSTRRSRSVSLLVPMRDEAHRLAGSLPGILAQDVDELILLDDCSTDDTGGLARALSTSLTHARVVAGAPTPPGWTGKTWACSQLAAEASSEILVFCDADILLAPGAVDLVLAQMERQQADLLSVFPQQLTETLGEHLIVPLVDDVLLCFLPFPLLRLEAPSAATANGSVMAFDRLAYEVLGGFDIVRDELVEDVALARLTRRSGLQLGLVLGGSVVRTRMYTGYSECVTAFARGLLPVTGGSRARLVLIAVWHLIAYTLPALLCWRQPRWSLPLLLAATERLAVEAKTGRRKWWQAILPPLSPLAALPVFALALRDTQQWKGRSYRHAATPGPPSTSGGGA
ncbi:MAG: glycosyltransferase [Nocardioidaceae bacterium]